VPLVVPASAKEEITREDAGWVFRVSATTGDYATVLLDLATGLGTPKTVAIVHEGTDFGTSGARSARLHAQAKGLAVVFEQAYGSHERDFRPMLLRAKEKRPDLVFLVSYVLDAMLLLEQSREVGLAPMAFLGAGAGYATTVFARNGEASHAVFSSAQWTPDVSPAAKKFAARYEDRFGKPPTYHAATAYASLTILGEVAARGGGDRAKVRAALDGGRWDGVAGPVRFEDVDGYTNQNRLRMLVEQVHGGRHATVWPREVATRKAIWPHPGANGPGSVATSSDAR
jgi:branched-chain amino acid transport system substrate-binding protein